MTAPRHLLPSCTLLAVLVLCSASVARATSKSEEWSVYTSPAGIYSVEYPSKWHVVREENVVNISPPDESGAVTISAYVGLPADPDLIKSLLSAPFAECEVRSPVKKEARNDWVGYSQEFSCPNQDGTREWIGTMAQNGRNSALITANDESRRMPKRRSTYLRILESLRVIKPAQAGSD